MKFGFFFQLPCAPRQSDQERYGNTLAQIQHGDLLGFDTAWLAEPHFFPEFSVMSSPLIVAAAAAQHTQRIRLGIAVSLLPLNNPIRSAEDAATVDILSHGRLVFGVGRGTNPLHYGGFNVPMEESRDRFTEALEIVTQVLSRRMVAGDADLDVATRERNKAMQARLQRLTLEEVRESVAIIGTPERCIDRIRWLQPEFHLNELICWFNPGGLMPHQTVLASMGRFAAHIMPNFR